MVTNHFSDDERKYIDTDIAQTCAAIAAEKRNRKPLKRFLNSLYGKCKSKQSTLYGLQTAHGRLYRQCRQQRMNPFQAFLTLLTMTGWHMLSSGDRRNSK